MSDDGFDLEDAFFAGTGYAMFRHGQDRQTQELIDAMRTLDVQRRLDDDHLMTADPEPPARPTLINNLDYVDDLPEDWEDYIGQDPLKNQMLVRISSALMRKARLPHILLASGYPGVGKTMMGRLIAKTMEVPIIELVPPFNIYTLVEAAQKLPDRGILFIDEIHKLADAGARGAEILLKIMEEGVAFMPDGEVVQLNSITILGATTEADKLPETILDRFKVKPYFQAYTDIELCRIAIQFAYRHRSENYVSNEIGSAIADACRGTPRIVEEMILAARDLGMLSGRPPTPQELLEFLEVEPDGLTRNHIHYLTAMRQYYARETKDEGIEYIAGEAAMQQMLRETKLGIGRLERFLVERGLVDRTPRGRRLTARGIARAEEFISNGKGVSDVA